MSKNQNDSANGIEDNTCIVCYKKMDLFSIGECNHPVCYECSTRMRVLCEQNECPICRQDLPKVIFTREVLPYITLDKQIRTGLYEKKFRICFADLDIHNAFYHLLENRCPKCKTRPFPTFTMLKEHVRKAHELFYCELCSDNVKIFCSERRCYSRIDLATHRRKGDFDDKSHRGHPLCQYCERRYLDKDELFRHLRRDHYFCHFCDTDGVNYFYSNYETLREHFKGEHFLCEEEECVDEQFTAVFRSEIDLRAHRATTHSKNLSKSAARQARVLELDFQYGTRRNAYGDGNAQQQQNQRSNQRPRNHDTQMEFEVPNSTEPSITQMQPQKIDARNEEEFPSLGGNSGSVVSNSMVRHVTYGQAGLARTKENFPALGSQLLQSGPGPSIQPSNQPKLSSNFQTKPVNSNVSNAAKSKSNKNQTAASLMNSFPTLPQTKPMSQPASKPVAVAPSRPTTSKKSTLKVNQVKDDFPSLANESKKTKFGKQLQMMEDLLPQTKNENANYMSAKHRLLANEYTSLASAVSSKVSTVTKKEEVVNADPKQNVPKLNSANMFPSLGAGGLGENGAPQWISGPRPNFSAQVEKKVETVKKAPKNAFVNLNTLNNKNKGKYINKVEEWKPEVKQEVKKEEKKSAKKAETKEVNNNSENMNIKNDITSSFQRLTTQTSTSSAPPPGFDKNKSENKKNPPPGFTNNNVVVNPTASSNGDLPDISHNGYNFLAPRHATKRNQELVMQFQKTLTTAEGMEEFRTLSNMFRAGDYYPQKYYESCQDVLSTKFDEIFPELLVLLPDISKQQELYKIYVQDMSAKSKKKQNKLKNITVCEMCKQVLLVDDLTFHYQSHSLENHFPNLKDDASLVKSAWKQ